MTIPAYAIGATTAALVSLESIGLPIPKASPVDYETYVDAGDGTRSGQGWLSCEWRFAYLTLAELTVLQAYAGTCGVITLTEAGAYTAYSALLVLPQRKPPKVDFVMDYAVIFRSLVAV